VPIVHLSAPSVTLRDRTHPRPRNEKNPSERGFSEEAHTGFEPVLPPKAGGNPDSGSRGRIAPDSELNPHLRAVLERLKERDRERQR
jgi:hypothetical protein